jgi:hypothetical protein
MPEPEDTRRPTDKGAGPSQRTPTTSAIIFSVVGMNKGRGEMGHFIGSLVRMRKIINASRSRYAAVSVTSHCADPGATHG